MFKGAYTAIPAVLLEPILILRFLFQVKTCDDAGRQKEIFDTDSFKKPRQYKKIDEPLLRRDRLIQIEFSNNNN